MQCFLFSGALLLSAMASAQAAIGDYHLHIQGPAVASRIGLAKAKHPEVFEGESDSSFREIDAQEVLTMLDEGGIREGTLLSEAYMISASWMDVAAGDISRLTRDENRFNVEAALASRGRLQAFISVNPVAANAMDELSYWANRAGVSGLKMHLAADNVDAASAADIEKLIAVFDFADRNSLPIVIHTRTGKDYPLANERALMERVLPHAKHILVQIAHSGTWAEVDQVAVDLLGVYAEAIERHAEGTEHLYFDLSALFVNDRNDPRMLQAFVTAMRRIGLRRFLPASDWPAFAKSTGYYALLRSQLPLTAAEWDAIFANEAPYFKRPREAARASSRSSLARNRIRP